MKQPCKSRLAGASLLACASAVLCGAHVGAARSTQADLGGPDRYLTGIATDKPIYRPGETIRVRGVILNAFKRTPLREQAMAVVEIKGPKGETVASGSAMSDASVWAFSWGIPGEQ